MLQCTVYLCVLINSRYRFILPRSISIPLPPPPLHPNFTFLFPCTPSQLPPSLPERSQMLNRAEALKRLKEKLSVIAQDQALSDFNDIKGDLVEASFGMQIR